MRPFILTILDGWGYSNQKHGNAILNAETPNINHIRQNYASMLIQASGKTAGMSWGEPGNSEVGHLTLGAGRVVFQYLSLIDKAISNGEFFNNTVFKQAIEHVKSNNSTLHIAGLLTSGSVHAYLKHLFALVDLATKNEIKNFKIHLFADGKDSGLKEGADLIKKLQEHIPPNQNSIATIIGRDYAMDRNKNWDLTKKAYDLLVRGEGEKVPDIIVKLEDLYTQGITDTKLPPLVIDEQGLIKENDAVIFFNFREDSMRQIVKSFVEPDFRDFPVEKFQNVFVVTMTRYLEDSPNVAFPLPEIKNSLAEVLDQNGKTQLHIAETEKYAHVTYFFNCLNNKPYDSETDVFIESEKKSGEHPEMKAAEIAEKVIAGLKDDLYDFYVINFANADVLAHQGNLEAAIKGVGTVDKAIGRLMETVLEKDGTMLITADHGNAESMLYESSGDKETKHNDNPIPLYLVGKEYQKVRSEEEIAKNLSQVNGLLADVAPTVLELMGIQKPVEMTGESLLPLLKG